MVLEAGVSVGEIRVDGGDVWWSESRPAEGGRIAVMHQLAGGTVVEAGPTDASVRTRVHEYGGGAWWVDRGTLFFADWATQRLYRADPGKTPAPITPVSDAPAGDRYADGVVTPDHAWVICVREQHGAGEPVNEIVAVPAYGEGPPQVLVSGPDFVAWPRVSPDGSRLCWIEWDHPDMPWDATRLKVAPIESSGGLVAGTVVLGEAQTVAGGPDESVQQPTWQGPDELLFITDRTGWWNLYRTPVDAPDAATNLAPTDRDLAGPAWVFGTSSYAVCDDGTIAVAVHHDGLVSLGWIADGSVELLDTGLTSFSQLHPLTGGVAPSQRSRSSVVCLGASFTREPTVLQIPVGTGASGQPLELRPAHELHLPPGLLSVPEHITFDVGEGEQAHALFYAPANPAVEGPEGDAPPLLVLSHSGPTAAARPQLSLDVQFWTSRGFGVVDVNYRGSVGYGREFRNALRDRWGVADVADCVTAAGHLASIGRADAERMAIRGGSAGGYTTLCALSMTDRFAAGVSRYGVADLAALARDTHKFESRYLDRLIGPWPEAEAVYTERSPIHHVDGFSCPLLVLQGLEDVIVPPAQSQEIVDALRAKGIPVAYVAFEGEQHGFRQAETIRRSLQAELAFYGSVFGFTPADELPPLDLR
jgi:dipeptidyl aminopeptidase/acylaminoacyl peptidase